MHQPETNQWSAIDQANFDRLRAGRPVYQDRSNTVVVSPEEFEATPKLSKVPYVAPPPTEQAIQGRAVATAISKLRCRDKKRGRK